MHSRTIHRCLTICSLCTVIGLSSVDVAYSQSQTPPTAPSANRQPRQPKTQNRESPDTAALTTGRLPPTGHTAGFGIQGNGGAKNRFGDDVVKRRTVSPYLSVIDNGNGFDGLNYYNIVRPQQRAQKQARSLRRELQTVETDLQIAERERKGLPPASRAITSGRMASTGHSAGFGNVGGYFPANAAGNTTSRAR